MGGKTSKSTQTVAIPPEVLARYNAVNARAEEVAGRPFQPYSYNPSDFVAQLTPTQLAGIQNVNYAAGQAQPFFDEATGQLMGAQAAAVPYYAAAESAIGAGQQYGMAGTQAAQDLMYQGLGYAMPLNYAAYGAMRQGYGQGQDLGQYALQTLGRAGMTGEGLSGEALGSLAGANYAAAPLQQLAQGIYGQAYQAAQPYNVAALQQYYGGLGAAAPVSQAALANLAAGQQMGQDVTSMALQNLGYGQAQAAPIQAGALEAIGAAPYAAAPLTQAAAQNIAGAQAGMAPYQRMATEFGLAGGRPVTPQELSGEQVQRYISPYLSNVVSQTQALLNQQAQQAQAEQLGNAIRSGAFGGDRAAIAAANLQQQQQLAQGKVISDLLQSGYGQALATAQQQQQLGLTAEQANRAAQQATAGQLLGIGQAGFGQNLAAAQQQAALGQQLFGQQLGAGQAQAALAQQLFGQGATTAQQQQAAAQALFGQSAQTAQQQAALAQQLFAQQAAAGQNIAGLGQQTFAQGLASGQAQQALAQQLFGQGATTAQQQAAIAQALFGQGATQAQQQAALAQQAYQQGLGFGTAQQGLGQQLFAQQLAAAQQQAALGQQGFAQQAATAQALQGLGQGLFGIGSGTAQQLAALGTGAQGTALQGAQAQLAAGQAQQQTAQAGLQALYNQFLQQQAYPFQTAQFLANIATGTGALSGSTQTAITPGGLFSDVRMKENLREVGKTFDGQPIYTYNYKGDDRTQMGLVAQEVERKHPEAVGLAGGMKTVDYDKATRDSARKPVTIDGEYTASEGGPVSMSHAGEKYARGGYANGGSPGLANPSDMAALLQAQAQMFGPFSGAGIPTTGMPGMPGYVPQANLPVSELITPGAMPAAPNAVDQMQKIADIGKTGQEIYQKYKDRQKEKSAVKPGVEYDTERARGGLLGYADGGSPGSAALPYSTEQTKSLAIPSEKTEVKKLEVPPIPQGRTVGEDVQAIANIAAAVASFSDARVKEDIKHIGNTYDGQKIYSYRFKGEPQTHIGLLAQEVEKKHPDAVGNAGGIKTVDYDAATKDAADHAMNVARKAAGGGVPTSLGIPSESIGGKSLSVPDMPEGRNALDDLSQLASIAKDVKTVYDEMPKEDKKPVQKAYGGGLSRDAYAVGGGDPSFAERMVPGIQTQEGVEANRRDILDFLRKRIIENPAINPMESLRRRQQLDATAAIPTATAAPAAAPAAVPPAAPPAAGLAGSSTTGSRRSPDRPFVDPAAANKPIPSSVFANLPESPEPGLAGGINAPATGLGAMTATPSAPASMTGAADLGLAPMLSGTARRQGEIPSPEQIAKDKNEPVESRMTAFMDWVRQPQNFIPLATGIAAATAAPTRNTFVALAQGLGAGAQAYQPVMQKQAELEKTRAETGKIGAEAGVYQANTLQELQQIANIRGLVPKEDANGLFRVGDKRYSLVPVSEAIAKPAAGGVLPTGAAGAPTSGVLGPNAVQAAQNAGTRFLTASEPEQAASRQQIDQSLAAGNKARNDLIDIQRFAQSAALPRTSVLEQGALFPIKQQLAGFYDSLITSFITDPQLREQMRIDPASMTQAQIAEKVAFGTAALREANAGQRSLGALEAFLAGNPNQTQTRETMVNLIADMIIHNQKLTDEAAAISDFDRLVESSIGLPRSFYYTDAVQAYQKDKPISAYESDRDQLVKIMMGNGYQELVNALKDPKVRPAMIDLLDKSYGNGFHRYFTGNVMQ